jgi:Short C-terminal domain
MERLGQGRSHRADLLVRPPCTVREIERGWAGLFVDPIEQLEALADLRSRDVLSQEEFDRQKAKILGT